MSASYGTYCSNMNKCNAHYVLVRVSCKLCGPNTDAATVEEPRTSTPFIMSEIGEPCLSMSSNNF